MPIEPTFKNTTVIVYGVSGCGKSTIGRSLSEKTGLPFFDADDFHPKENVEKMSKGIPLNDADRAPWLERLAEHLKEKEGDTGAILACSALKEAYREVLATPLKKVYWVLLNGSFEMIEQRIKARQDHYMGPGLLRSQFDALEEPVYGLKIDVSNPPKEIINTIISTIMEEQQTEFGLYGLGVMGKSISLNIAEKGKRLSVFNRLAPGEETVVSDFIEAKPENFDIQGYSDLDAFISSMKQPRKILMMIKAGPTVDLVLDQLLEKLSPGDVVIDGGNSHYKRTAARFERAADKGIGFIGAGISGGEEGARKGPSIMPGGSREDYGKVADVLESIAAKTPDGKSCCTYIGPEGSGHFIKMVHNGIEYVEMQLLAEIYALLKGHKTNEEMSTLFGNWNEGSLKSYLLGISANIFEKKEGADHLIDKILDRAGNKGTGSWSSIAALELGVPVPMMTASVFARYISSWKDERQKHHATFGETKHEAIEAGPDLDELSRAYAFCRIMNHLQGFYLMYSASEEHQWGLNFADIAKIWTEGCIIKSSLMEELAESFQRDGNLVFSKHWMERLSDLSSSMVAVLDWARHQRVSMSCFSSALDFWFDLTNDRLPANLIQAQRDYFGAHTFEKTDQPRGKFFHVDWLE